MPGKKISILFIDKDPVEQFIFAKTFSDLEDRVEVDFLMNTQQLTDFLFKDQLQRDLNRQKVPDFVFVNAYDLSKELEPVKKIRSREEFSHLPFYFFTDVENSDGAVKDDPATTVLGKAETFQAYSEMVLHCVSPPETLIIC
jgi:hypothetical protein